MPHVQRSLGKEEQAQRRVTKRVNRLEIKSHAGWSWNCDFEPGEGRYEYSDHLGQGELTTWCQIGVYVGSSGKPKCSLMMRDRRWRRKRRGGDEKSHGLGAAYRLAPTSLLPSPLSQHGVLILSNWRSCFGLWVAFILQISKSHVWNTTPQCEVTGDHVVLHPATRTQISTAPLTGGTQGSVWVWRCEGRFIFPPLRLSSEQNKTKRTNHCLYLS